MAVGASVISSNKRGRFARCPPVELGLVPHGVLVGRIYVPENGVE